MEELEHATIESYFGFSIQKFFEITKHTLDQFGIAITKNEQDPKEKYLEFDLYLYTDFNRVSYKLISWSNEVEIEPTDEQSIDRFLKKETIKGYAALALENNDKELFMHYTNLLKKL